MRQLRTQARFGLLAVSILAAPLVFAACADDAEGTPSCPDGFIRAGEVCIPAPDVGGDVAADADVGAPDVGQDAVDVGPDAPDVTQDVPEDVVEDVIVIYQQDFESFDPADPDALGDDGWVFFGNVAAADAVSCEDSDECGAGSSCENFAGDQVCVKFGYGPNPAPTTSGFISALVTDQGGAEQGTRQLSIFSDYECCQPDDGHFNGTDLVETNVYQEFTIPAAWVGRTFTFQFDAKRGDITGGSIAEAFIKTLDPNDGFRTTNEEVLDTTGLTADWATFTVTFELTDPRLEGQLLQFGFTTIASDFESSGNYFDNVIMSGEAVECVVDGDCDDENDCTDDTCDGGECAFTNNDENTCTLGGGLSGACNAGDCEGLCVDVTCPDEECKTYTCDPADGECDAVNDSAGTPCDLGSGPGSGICDDAGTCAACSLDTDCTDANACTDNACVEGVCVFTNDDTNECSVGELSGTCDAGICVPPPICEYQQDLEGLDDTSATALSDDGWLFFGNVFDSGGNFKFGYGPFAAPNATVSPSDTFISAVVSGEGDVEQGDQQLSVFNDYNCCGSDEGHFGTDRVEISVFQELTIPAAFIGQVYEFTFDAKAGNIEGATTALAFIKTLDPDASFATTNFITEDTTSLPADWGTYTVTLDMSNPDLEGQLLQFGFATTASNFEGSGNFYDNIAFGTQGCGGECAVDDDCPDTGNDCTTAVCDAEFTCQAENVTDGISCDDDTGLCSAGVCAECILDGDCEDDNDCTDDTCGDGVCVFTNDDTNACMLGELPGTCDAGVCEGLCADVVCTDPGECVTSTCDPADGLCDDVNDGAGTGCDLGTGPGSGVCDGDGTCVACTLDTDCEDNNECTDNACVEGACVFTNDDTNVCTIGELPGNCSAGVCEGLCEDVVCTDPGECAASVCDPADGECDTQNDPINTGCDLGGGPDTGVCDGSGTCVACNFDEECDSFEACVANVCEPSGLFCPYTGSLELLDPADENALENDGWLYFGNVFDSTGAFKFGFGPFPAPTTSGQISAIATGEGGADQGDNQLLVFSNYDCCDPDGHNNGTDLVETNVFQEVASIPSSYIGRVFTFQFDAKAGDIEGSSTAQAYIRTLNPAAGFAVTNEVVLDTTALSADWATYSIELNLGDPALEGQVLQFGFQTVASNFEAAGNYYDNISFCTPDGGECVVALDCEATGNDCVAPVCDAGTCGTSNALDGTACDDNTGICGAGVCEPAILACEYQQDLEALDPEGDTALGDDGWLYFGVVFDSAGAFKFQFGPNPAPTTTGQVSAIATGEGGADQGDNQLLVFSNYECCGEDEGHFGTDLVETIVFQEIASIPSDYIGQVFTFTFDAKRGDIEGASTAQAFIRTLDPNAGFSRTNNVVFDTTNLPADWATYRIALDMSNPALEGQILQFGFSTIASNFEASGNYYDNISFCTEDAGAECSVGGDCPDDGNECTTATCTDGTCGTETATQQGVSCDGGDGTCDAGVCVPTGGATELTTNGGFETGDFTGWTETCDGVDCSVTDVNPNGGTYAANVVNNTPASSVIIKQANIGVGVVQPGDTISISFFARGSTADGGVVFAEFFSEIDGGGVSASEILGGGPLALTGNWTEFTFETTAGPDVSGGVSLQFAVITGGAGTSAADFFVDDVSVTVADGGPECVDAGDCPDDGNECTTATCIDNTCGTETTTQQGVSCDGGAGTCDAGVCEPNGGGGTELTTNGDFETGDFTGWEQTCDGAACNVIDVNPNGGTYAANVTNTTPASSVIIKQANIGVGVVAPGDDVSIRFFARGSAVDGGVVFAEFFSELDGGGVSASEILGGGPLALTADWTEFTFETTAGPDVSGGVTLQFAVVTGGAGTSAADFFVDDVSVIAGGGGGGDTPTSAAPTPTEDAGDVISLFSDAYDDVPVDTWSTVWDNTTLAEPDPLIEGNAVKLYTNHAFAGIEFTGANSIDATGMTHFHIDVWSPNATRVALRLVDFGPDNSFDGGDDTQNNPLIEFTSGTDPALQTGTWNSFDVPLSTFESLGLANRANLSQFILEANPPGTTTLYVDNVYFYAAEVATEPTSAAPTPTEDAGNVISLFSDAYDDVPVDTWSTVWDNTTLAEPDPLIAGDAVKLYTNHAFAGIEFTGANSIDATGMTHFHIDVWSPNATRVALRLVDFGPDNGFDGGDDTQNNPLIEFTSSTDPALQTGTWNSFDVPLSTFESLGLANRANLSQFILEANPPGTTTLYVDNVYFYSDTVATWTPPVVFGDDLTEGVAFAGFSDSDNSTSIDTAEARPGSTGTASYRVEVPATGFTGGSLLASAPADLTAYDALVFWARASGVRTLDVAGFGDDTAGGTTYRTERFGIPLTTAWTQFVIAIPDPTQVTGQVGLFHFAEGSAPEGAGTIWFDDIGYASLGTITNPRPDIDTVTQQLPVSQTYQVVGQSLIVAVDGSDQSLEIGPGYFDYASSAEAVATVDGVGVVTGVSEGTANITAELAGTAAAGTTTIEVIPPFDCTATTPNLAVNGDFETGDFSCMTQFPQGGTQAITTNNPSSGTYAANLNVVTVEQATLIKFANLPCFDGGLGICTVDDTYPTDQTIYISFDMRGSVTAGGVVNIELFSELAGGGVSRAVDVFGGPIFPTAGWQTYTATSLAGPDTNGGITLQLKAASGAGTADIYFDNVCISVDPAECVTP